MTNALARKDWSGDFLSALANIAGAAAPKAIKPDEAEVETDQLCIDGTRFRVPVAEKDLVFNGARNAVFDGAKVLARTVVARKGGGERFSTFEERDEEGHVRTVSVAERLDEEGNVKALVKTTGTPKHDKLASFASFCAEATYPAFYTGAAHENGHLGEEVQAISLVNGEFRVLTARVDVERQELVGTIRRTRWEVAYEEKAGKATMSKPFATVVDRYKRAEARSDLLPMPRAESIEEGSTDV